jgi:Flp pilus assembly protein TadD
VLYERGNRLIDPYMKLQDRPDTSGATRERDLREGIVCLDRVVELAPSNWAALWVRGKAYQALDLHDRARDSFRSAYDIHPQNPDVGRELVVECLELGLTKEAVRVAEETLATSPDNPGLRANLALALVLDGEVDRAKKEASQALAQDPGDPVTRVLEARIDEVARGVRPRPGSLREFERAGGP